MTKKPLRIVQFLCILVIIAFLIIFSMNLFSKCSKWIIGGDGKIEELNGELRNLLLNKYMLYVDDDIIFVEGYYDNAFQDSSIHLTLKVPNSNIDGFYNKGYYREESFPGREAYKRLTYDRELYTYIDFYAFDNDYKLVEFTGRYPGSNPGVKSSK